MHRLFVAIRPPRALREALIARMGGIANARWQTDEQLHITLRFIGEVDRHRADDIAAALAMVHHPRFDVALNGIGQFDRKGRADTLWAGLTPHDALESLHRKIDQALARVGIAEDRRAYLPHITIARLGRTTGPLDHFLAAAGGLSSPSAPIDSFCLYESSLSRTGSLYTIVERYPLD